MSFQEQEDIPRETWENLPSLPPFTGSTVLNVGRMFYIHSPSTILKLGTDEGEGTMTALAQAILGACVPRVVSIVTIPSKSRNTDARQGLILTRQPGRPIVELWPSLSPSQRKVVKTNLRDLLIKMRLSVFAHYGRPAGQPYVLNTEMRPDKYAYCNTRSKWDDSRVRAMHFYSSDARRLNTLEQVQRGVTGMKDWDRPVLTHGDLSDRNILVHPHTLKVTGFLDWEMANIIPAYFEYVAARLCEGHDSEWRRELLDVLRDVLRSECSTKLHNNLTPAKANKGNASYERTLAAWDAITNVERVAQGYDDDCYWTFETGFIGCTTKKVILLFSLMCIDQSQ